MGNSMTAASLFSITPAGKSAGGVRGCRQAESETGQSKGILPDTSEKNDFSKVISKVISQADARGKAPVQTDASAHPESAENKKTPKNPLETDRINIQDFLAFIQQMIQQGIVTIKQLRQWLPENISPEQFKQLQQWLTKDISPDLLKQGIEGDRATRQEILQDFIASLEELSDSERQFAEVNRPEAPVKDADLKNVLLPGDGKRNNLSSGGLLKNAGNKLQAFRDALLKLTGDKEESLKQGDASLITGGKASLDNKISPFASLARAADKLPGQNSREKLSQLVTHLMDVGGVAAGDGLKAARSGETSAALKVMESADAGPVDITGQIVRAVNFSQQDGQYRVRMTLQPPHLGNLDVALSVKNHHIHAVFLVDNSAAHEAVTHELPQLQAHLVQQGFKVSDFSVQVGTGDSRGFQAFQRNPQFSDDGADGKNRGRIKEPDGILPGVASSQDRRVRGDISAGPERINVFI